jgi:hypothetical protein
MDGMRDPSIVKRPPLGTAPPAGGVWVGFWFVLLPLSCFYRLVRVPRAPTCGKRSSTFTAPRIAPTLTIPGAARRRRARAGILFGQRLLTTAPRSIGSPSLPIDWKAPHRVEGTQLDSCFLRVEHGSSRYLGLYGGLDGSDALAICTHWRIISA